MMIVHLTEVTFHALKRAIDLSVDYRIDDSVFLTNTTVFLSKQ